MLGLVIDRPRPRRDPAEAGIGERLTWGPGDVVYTRPPAAPARPSVEIIREQIGNATPGTAPDHAVHPDTPHRC